MCTIIRVYVIGYFSDTNIVCGLLGFWAIVPTVRIG